APGTTTGAPTPKLIVPRPAPPQTIVPPPASGVGVPGGVAAPAH
ncbi:MAG: hypothetical protein QOE44_1946, partial [Solirubrobacteraceae bacterium]|nr:hypothetical protein [Solirubrobacteraceae bacterium]